MIRSIVSATLLAVSAHSTEPQSNAKAPVSRIEVAAICFKSGEQTSGMNKICYYDCLGSTKAITISSTSLCPLTIEG